MLFTTFIYPKSIYFFLLHIPTKFMIDKQRKKHFLVMICVCCIISCSDFFSKYFWNIVLNFSKNFYLDDSGISLTVSPSRTNLKLHSISVTPTIVKKVKTNLDLSKIFGPDSIPVVVQKTWTFSHTSWTFQ